MNEPSVEKEKSQFEKPALTIQIHSWATPLVGFLMFIVGLLAGYFVRPAIAPLLGKPTPAPTASPQASADETSSDLPGLKDYVVAQTQHFLGDPNAPVTVIEFSDFQ